MGLHRDGQAALAVADIGNSAAKIGLVDRDTHTITQRHVVPDLEDCAALVRTFSAFGHLVYSNVRPGLQEAMICPPGWRATPAERLLTDSPIAFAPRLDLGVDRKLACIGAINVVEQPFVVIGLGTATTVTLVQESRCLFSVISAGIGLSIEAIREHTRIKDLLELPGHVTYGDLDADMDLSDSVNVGVVASTALALNGWLAYLRDMVGCSPNAVLTGGYSDHVSALVTFPCLVEPDLTLLGILHVMRAQGVE